MPVEKDINLDKPLTTEDINNLEEEANRLEKIAKEAKEDAKKAKEFQTLLFLRKDLLHPYQLTHLYVLLID